MDDVCVQACVAALYAFHSRGVCMPVCALYTVSMQAFELGVTEARATQD